MTNGESNVLANPSLRHSLAIQARVVGALILREALTRYGRRNIGFMWLFLEPMLFTIGVAALWTLTRGAHGSNLPIVPFAITGYSTVLLWRNAASRCSKAIENNVGLLYHRNVLVLDLYAARLLLEVAGATISLVILSLIAIAGGWMGMPADLLTMIAGWLLMIFFAIALGLNVGALSERSVAFERIWPVFTYLMFPLSGAMFMVDWLPTTMQELVLWVPMIHAVEMLRDGYYGETVRTHYDVAYLLIVNMGMMLAGLQLVHQNKKLVVVE